MNYETKLDTLDIKDIQSQEAFFLRGIPYKRDRKKNLEKAHEFLEVLSLIPLRLPVVFIDSETGTLFEIQGDCFANFPMGKFFKLAREYQFDYMRQDTVNEKTYSKVYCTKREANE